MFVLMNAGPTAPSAEAVEYRPPVVITKGGTYTGAWQSLNPDVAAIRIRTSEPVTIQDCWLRGRGALIKGSGDIKVTVRNCRGYGLNPNVAGRVPGRFLGLEGFDNVVVENNYMEGTSGISVRDYEGNGMAEQTVKIRRNRAKNIDGRRSNGSGGFSQTGFAHVQFVRLSKARHMQSVEIAWNEVVNEPGKSRVEENINMYLSSGTAASPVRIHNNFIRGAYPTDPTSTRYSGGGILLGDGASSDAGGAAAFVHAFGNQIVSTTGHGIGIAAGHDNKFFNNRMIASGRLADGSWIGGQNVGAYIWDVYDRAGYNSRKFYNNYAYDNVIGWMRMKKDGSRELKRNDWWFPDCARWLDGRTKCDGNRALPAPITRETEAAEFQRWQSKVGANNVRIGPVSGI